MVTGCLSSAALETETYPCRINGPKPAWRHSSVKTLGRLQTKRTGLMLRRSCRSFTAFSASISKARFDCRCSSSSSSFKRRIKAGSAPTADGSTGAMCGGRAPTPASVLAAKLTSPTTPAPSDTGQGPSNRMLLSTNTPKIEDLSSAFLTLRSTSVS
ncbi:hypothetical protein MHYP_G00088830 [Metynnis hypsauchen]